MEEKVWSKTRRVASLVVHGLAAVALMVMGALFLVWEPQWPDKLVSAFDYVPATGDPKSGLAEQLVKVTAAASLFIGAVWLLLSAWMPAQDDKSRGRDGFH